MNSHWNTKMTRMRPLDFFHKYIASAVDNIYHQSIVSEWRANMDKVS